MPHDDERPRPSEQPDEAPGTPPDEPEPAPVEDPPSEPDRAPYVVKPPVNRWVGELVGTTRSESSIMSDANDRLPGERKERRGFASMTPEKQREIEIGRAHV